MHDIWCFESRHGSLHLILAVSDFIVELGALERTNVGGVGAGDGDSVRFEELLCSVQTLRAELVVAETAEQLRHENVGIVLLRGVPVTHVTRHNCYLLKYVTRRLKIVHKSRKKYLIYLINFKLKLHKVIEHF